MANPPKTLSRPQPTPMRKTAGRNPVSMTLTPLHKPAGDKENRPLTNTTTPLLRGRPNPVSVSQRTPLTLGDNEQRAGTPSIQSLSSQMKALQDELSRERAENQRLQATLTQTTPHSNSGASREATPVVQDPQDLIKELEAKLKKEQQLVARLRAGEPTTKDTGLLSTELPVTLIPRPRGTAGKDYSIQVAMGLANSKRNNEKYAQIMRGLRDLVLNAQMNWELSWGEIPASEKAKLFSVARERHPLLARYENDWATSDIVRRYMKNKRNHHYKNGWLDVPEKYSYLKKNASQRNPEGSRTKRAKAALAAAKKGKSRAAAARRRRSPPVEAEADMDVDFDGEDEDEDVEDEDVEEENIE